MRKTSLVALAFALLFSSALAQTYNGWIRFSPKGAGFVVMLPGEPKEDTDVKPNFTTHMYTVTVGKAIFLVGYGQYAPGVHLDPQKELEANRDNFNKGLKATLLTSRSFELDGRVGLEFTSETSGVDLKSRVFLVDNKVFQLATLVFKGNDETRSVDRFLDSFAFTTPE